MKMQEKRESFLAGSAGYGMIFAFCIHGTLSGTGVTLMFAATGGFLLWMFGKAGMKVKKETAFYLAAMLLMGVSVVYTTVPVLVFGGWAGGIALFFMALLHQFYEDTGWLFGRYIRIYLRMLFAPVGRIWTPFRDMGMVFFARKENTGKKGYARQILLGVLAGAGLLIVIIPLLVGGDMVFAEFLRRMKGNVHFSLPFGWLFLFLFGFIMCYAVFGAFAEYQPEKERNEEEETEKREMDEKRRIPVTGITCLSILAAVYILYSGIQLVSLFLAKGTGLPEGVTYAQYARSGFFELLFICCINLAIVLLAIHIFQEHKLMQGILTVISACTYMMILSSGYRMWMYIQAYHFTMLRALVIWLLCVLSFILAGVIVNVYRKKFPLFRFCAVILSVFWLAFSLSKPGLWMAKYNAAHTDIWSPETVDDMSFSFGNDALAAFTSLSIEKKVMEGNRDGSIYAAKDALLRWSSFTAEQYRDLSWREWSFAKNSALKAAEKILREYENIT